MRGQAFGASGPSQWTGLRRLRSCIQLSYCSCSHSARKCLNSYIRKRLALPPGSLYLLSAELCRRPAGRMQRALLTRVGGFHKGTRELWTASLGASVPSMLGHTGSAPWAFGATYMYHHGVDRLAVSLRCLRTDREHDDRGSVAFCCLAAQSCFPPRVARPRLGPFARTLALLAPRTPLPCRSRCRRRRGRHRAMAAAPASKPAAVAVRSAPIALAPVAATSARAVAVSLDLVRGHTVFVARASRGARSRGATPGHGGIERARHLRAQHPHLAALGERVGVLLLVGDAT